jgi:hypothetical protein
LLHLNDALGNISSVWIGYIDSGIPSSLPIGEEGTNGSGGAYTSALPFYFGLMAIAGAYLIKE